MLQNELSLERNRNKKLTLAKQFYMDALKNTNKNLLNIEKKLNRAVFWQYTNIWIGFGVGILATLVASRIIGG